MNLSQKIAISLTLPLKNIIKVPNNQIVIANECNPKIILTNDFLFLKKTKIPKEKTSIALIKGKIIGRVIVILLFILPF